MNLALIRYILATLGVNDPELAKVIERSVELAQKYQDKIGAVTWETKTDADPAIACVVVMVDGLPLRLTAEIPAPLLAEFDSEYVRKQIARISP